MANGSKLPLIPKAIIRNSQFVDKLCWSLNGTSALKFVSWILLQVFESLGEGRLPRNSEEECREPNSNFYQTRITENQGFIWLLRHKPLYHIIHQGQPQWSWNRYQGRLCRHGAYMYVSSYFIIENHKNDPKR